MRRIDHAHLHAHSPAGPPGTLYAHFHSSCPKDGLTFQCPMRNDPQGPPCGHVYTIPWDVLDTNNDGRFDGEDVVDTIQLPACPACGAITFFGHNDIWYGLDLPEYDTMRIVREHIATRPAFKKLSRFKASRFDGRFQGSDFSNLEPAKRPPNHRDPARYPEEQP